MFSGHKAAILFLLVNLTLGLKGAEEGKQCFAGRTPLLHTAPLCSLTGTLHAYSILRLTSSMGVSRGSGGGTSSTISPRPVQYAAPLLKKTLMSEPIAPDQSSRS